MTAPDAQCYCGDNYQDHTGPQGECQAPAHHGTYGENWGHDTCGCKKFSYWPESDE